MYTVYDYNKHYCCCEENYLLWLCLIVFSVLSFLKLYPYYMIIIHTPGYRVLCGSWTVTIPHMSRQGGAQLPKHSMANLRVQAFGFLSLAYMVT